MTTGAWKIRMEQDGRGSVELDGVKVANVRAVTVRAGVGEIAVVTLELNAGSVEFEGQAERGDVPGQPIPVPSSSLLAVTHWTHFCAYRQRYTTIRLGASCSDCAATPPPREG